MLGIRNVGFLTIARRVRLSSRASRSHRAHPSQEHAADPSLFLHPRSPSLFLHPRSSLFDGNDEYAVGGGALVGQNGPRSRRHRRSLRTVLPVEGRGVQFFGIFQRVNYPS